MKIKEWWFKNYKSYGTVKEVIQLNQVKGELILLFGSNGKGKSSILSSLDLAIFGEELNRQGKRLSQKLLPNRINGNLEVGCIFSTDEELYIQRTMDNTSSPLKTKLVIDKIPFGKANGVDDKILEKVGFDFKTFKSFISMNINHFKNFISLSPEEKRILLDKLFNLETINELNKILKQLAKNNDINF
jgi:DNA repair exonuclease SbcCD ATPase subunit